MISGFEPEEIRGRFEQRVAQIPFSDCWYWAGSSNNHGYGVLSIYDKNNWRIRKDYGAHRISYQIHVGAIPKNALVCHHCDNRLCVNPSHLFLGSPSDNMQDKVKKNRQARLCGAKNPMAKLDNKSVAKIRWLVGRDRKISVAECAEMFRVSTGAIYSIAKGKRW